MTSTTTEQDATGLKATLLGELTAAQAFAQELLRHKKYLNTLKNIVAQQTGRSFEPIAMMILYFAHFGISHADKFIIEPIPESKCDKFGFKEFHYHHIQIENEEVLFPKLLIDERVLKPLQTTKWKKIIDKYLVIAGANHDFLENIVPPNSIDGGNVEFFVRVAEQLVTQLHNLVIDELIKDITTRHKFIRTTVEAIYELQEFANSETPQAKEIADIWLNCLMSALLYHIPIHKYAFEKTATQYGDKSIDDALKAYGIEHRYEKGDMDKLLATQIINTNKPHYTGIPLLKHSNADTDTSYTYANPYCLSATITFQILTNISAESESTNLTGFHGYLAKLLFQDNPQYDFGHFWASSPMEINQPDVCESDASIKELFLFDLAEKIATRLQLPAEPTCADVINAYYDAILELPALDIDRRKAHERLDELRKAIKQAEAQYNIPTNHPDSILKLFPTIPSPNKVSR